MIRQVLLLAATAFLGQVVTADAQVPQETRLALSAPARSLLVRPGGQVVYDVHISQSGDPTGTPVTLAATLPPGLTYRGGSSLLDGAPVADPTILGNVATWSLPEPGSQKTRYGAHAFVQDTMDAHHIATQLGWSRALTGVGGYVKELLYPVTPSTPGAQQSWEDFVAAAYDRGLIPVLRLQGSYNPKAGRWDKPQIDPDGSYSSTAEAFRRVVAQLPRRDGYPLYVEVWNEPNLDVEWGGKANPAEYARFLLAVAQAIRSLGDPHVLILNAALSPGGDYPHLDFLDDMFRSVPAAAFAFDVWASHPYAGNHPPSFDGNYYSVRGYDWELSRLSKYRNLRNVKVMATEAGYALGNRDDPRYPPIDEANRAAYTQEALERFWSTDKRLIAVMPFELSDPFNSWSAFDWVYPASGTRPDGSPSAVHPVYDSIRALPRPAMDLVLTFATTVPSAEGAYKPVIYAENGSTGIEANGDAVVVSSLARAGVISGQVVLSRRWTAAAATVTVGSFATKVAADGIFHIAVPPGSYSVSVSAPGYPVTQRNQVTVQANARTTLPIILMDAGP